MTTSHVGLGYEVGTGRPVEIPVRHMCVTGQTQEAGKTTTLEALIARSGLRAVTFVTKRGEGSFTNARRIDPYFREQADWQFVASILEASRGEKLKFERAWIIRASKGATTLAEVHRNVKRALVDPKIRGMSADVYLTLDAYLEVVVPMIAAITWAHALEIKAGINAVDVTALPVEMQHLVIKSSLDWVLDKEDGVVVVIPEAWKFVPEGRGTPVKRSALALIRQGAGLGNYVWLDSQDIGGVDKEILRSVPVWVLGVQREINEIKRTLDNIPAGISKPSRSEIATLEVGQFIACWGKHAIKTYVQPAWMNAAQAEQVATGALSLEWAARANLTPRAAPMLPRIGATPKPKEDRVTRDEADRLSRQNEQLQKDNAELKRRLAALEKGSDDARVSTGTEYHGSNGGAAERGSIAGDRGRDDRDLRPGGSVQRGGGHGHRGRAALDDVGRTATATHPDFSPESEAFYQAIKTRLVTELADGGIFEVLISRPEIAVKVTRRRIEIDGDSLRGRIARLIAEAYFAKSRTSADIGSELERRGDRPANIELGNELKALTKMGFFTRENKWFSLVPDMVVNVVEE